MFNSIKAKVVKSVIKSYAKDRLAELKAMIHKPSKGRMVLAADLKGQELGMRYPTDLNALAAKGYYYDSVLNQWVK